MPYRTPSGPIVVNKPLIKLSLVDKVSCFFGVHKVGIKIKSHSECFCDQFNNNIRVSLFPHSFVFIPIDSMYFDEIRKIIEDHGFLVCNLCDKTLKWDKIPYYEYSDLFNELDQKLKNKYKCYECGGIKLK